MKGLNLIERKMGGIQMGEANATSSDIIEGIHGLKRDQRKASRLARNISIC